jgi:hypothetical protein
MLVPRLLVLFSVLIAVLMWVAFRLRPQVPRGAKVQGYLGAGALFAITLPDAVPLPHPAKVAGFVVLCLLLLVQFWNLWRTATEERRRARG